MAHAKTFDGVQNTKINKMEIGSIPEDCDDDGRTPRRNGEITLELLPALIFRRDWIAEDWFPP